MKNCTEDGCKGILDLDSRIEVQTGCGSRCGPPSRTAFPCDNCGRLYFLVGDEAHKNPVGVERRSGEKAFLENGEIVLR